MAFYRLLILTLFPLGHNSLETPRVPEERCLLVWEGSHTQVRTLQIRYGMVRLGVRPGGEKAATFPCRPGTHSLGVTCRSQRVNQRESLLLALKRTHLFGVTPRLRRAGGQGFPPLPWCGELGFIAVAARLSGRWDCLSAPLRFRPA